MFTGLIHSVGKVHRKGKSLAIEGCQSFAPMSLGDSVAVDGVCLTVQDLYRDGFLADVSEETLSRTTLGQKADIGSFVNLEPALRLSDRLGGHLVSGHIDCVGSVVDIEKLANSWRIDIGWKDKTFQRYMCDKASIAIDGISLTAASVSREFDSFSIAVIPHTWENTSLRFLSVGDPVNLEVDLMAKYAEALLKNTVAFDTPTQSSVPDISSEWLVDNGWS